MDTVIQLYDDVTGVFTRVAFAVDRAAAADVSRVIENYLISGHKAYAGPAVDVLSQKMDVLSGKLVACPLPEPSDAHQLSPTATQRGFTPDHPNESDVANVAAAQIAELERRQQRPLREFALGMPGARERLVELNRQIAALR
jgi:hypothetical protein